MRYTNVHADVPSLYGMLLLVTEVGNVSRS